MTTLFSVGHSNHSADKFMRLLDAHKIDFIVDVRRSPNSRFPHFCKDSLAAMLRGAGKDYRAAGTYLGGLKEGTPVISVEDRMFLAKMDAVLDFMKEGKTVALMCSEGKPCECHRAGKLFAWYHRNKPELKTAHILPDGELIDGKEYEPKVIKEVVWPTYATPPKGQLNLSL